MLQSLPEDKFRSNVGIIVFNKEGKVWLGQRIKSKKYLDGKVYDWQLPQGGIDKGETIEAAARRELFEETGMKSVKIIFITSGWLYYYFPSYMKSKKYQGQKQKWAVMLFIGKDEEINFLHHDEQEFFASKWVSLDNIAKQVIPFKRHIYLELQKLLVYIPDFIINMWKQNDKS